MMDTIMVEVYSAHTGKMKRTTEKTFAEFVKWVGRAGARGYSITDDGDHNIRIHGGDDGDPEYFFIIRNVR